MKNQLLFIFLFLSLLTFSQSAESLKIAVKKNYQANYLMDFEAMVAYSYPKMVATIGNEVMLKNAEQHYENTEFRLRLQLEMIPFQYGDIKQIAGKSFCVITCRNPMRYFFEAKLTTETAAEKAIWLKEINTTKEVIFEPNRYSFNVKRTTTFVAILDETTNKEWKFFNFDEAAQYNFFQTLFDASTKKELGL